MNMPIFSSRQQYRRVLIPDYLENNLTCDNLELYGYAHEDTQIYVVVADNHHNPPETTKVIGCFCDKPLESGISLVNTAEGKTQAYIDGQPAKTEIYSAVQKIFSRNTGLLETDWMKSKCAVIAGVGSVGGFIAVELAKSGVGRFVLIDTDVLEIHNLCRHICGMEDVGRLKIDAIKDKILNINPNADVIVFDRQIENVTEDDIGDYLGYSTVIVGACDNRRADYYCNRLAKETNSCFVSIGFWTRAFAGELFFWIPGIDQPCYECLHGKDQSMNRVEKSIFYADQESLKTISFEPGLGVDIDYVNTIGVRLILDLLNLGNEDYIFRIIPHYHQYILVCNSNDERIAGEQSKLFEYPLQVLSIPVKHSSECTICHGKTRNSE